MSKWKIQGKLSVSIEDDKVIFSIVPSQEFLSPDGKHKLCYDYENKQVRMINNEDKFEAKIDKKYINYLIHLAINQHIVELTLYETKGFGIVGFKYPVERNK